MAVTFTNILVGEAVVKVDGTDVGGTQDGASISWEPDMVDIEIDQFGDAARVVTAKIKVHVKTKLAEGTLDNLAMVWNYPSSKVTTGGGFKTFNVGLQTVYPTEHTLVLTGNGPGTTASVTKGRTYTCGRVISYSSSEHTMKRADNVSFPVDFRILPDPTQTGKEYGTIVDVFP